MTLTLQLEKYRKADFGRCPRVYCYSQPLLPVGLSDIPYQKAVKLYCPRCEDIYSPKSNRHGSIDGAYFGTTFPHMLFMVYPQMIPTKGQPLGTENGSRGPGSAGGIPGGLAGLGSLVVGGAGGGGGRDGPASVGAVSTAAAAMKAERYEPRIFGFRVHEEAQLARWRQARRDASVFPDLVNLAALIIYRQIARLEALDREQVQPNA